MAANLRTWAQRQTATPVGNLIELDLSHPFFAADEWDVFYAGTYYTKQNPEGTPSELASALLNGIKGSPAGVLYGTDSTSGTLSSRHRLFPLPDQRHVLLTFEGSAQQYVPQEGAVRTYVGITHVTPSGIVRFGNGGAPASTTRRDYTYTRGNDGTGVLIVPAASATTAPRVFTGGAQQTATYSSGTGTTYDWGTSDTWGMVGFAIGANAGEAGFCPFTAASTAVDLPAALYAELSANPWALLKPRRIWVPVPVSAGGSTWDADLTESATAADAATAAYIATASVSESIAAADSLAAATTWVRSLTEAASTADALASAVTWARALTEAASASDLATAIRHAVAALTEAATASDSQATGSIYTGAVAEAASVSDALTAAATLVALLTEVATASDAASSAATWVRLLTEPAAAVDSVAGAQGATYTASVTEVLAATELLVAVLAAQGVISAPPLGHGLGMSRRVTQAGRSRPANLNDRTR